MHKESQYIESTEFFDCNHEHVQQFVDEHADTSNEEALAISLYLAVRDAFHYVPFDIRLTASKLKASGIVSKGSGHCVDKASFLISCYRKAGLPARLGLAKVKNHVGTERLEKILGTNVLVPHGYVDVKVNGHWVKCTPAFNKALCEKLKVDVLDFDAQTDSIFQPYDREGADFMEYIEDYGTFADLPLEFIIELMKKEYPQFFDGTGFIQLM